MSAAAIVTAVLGGAWIVGLVSYETWCHWKERKHDEKHRETFRQ